MDLKYLRCETNKNCRSKGRKVNHTVYVFINKKGLYFGNLQSSREVTQRRDSRSFYKSFDKALLFSSEHAANIYRATIINIKIIDQMILVPLEIIIDSKQIFKAILRGV